MDGTWWPQLTTPSEYCGMSFAARRRGETGLTEKRRVRTKPVSGVCPKRAQINSGSRVQWLQFFWGFSR